jgi:hypothetical protein
MMSGGEEEEGSEPMLEEVLGSHELRRKVEAHRKHLGLVGGMPEEPGLSHARFPGQEDEAGLALDRPIELARNEFELRLAAWEGRVMRRMTGNSYERHCGLTNGGT